MSVDPEVEYAALVQVARGDIPERFARLLAVAVSPDEQHAVVLLQTNEPPAVELYEVICHREGERWCAGIGSSGVGLGWASMSHASDQARESESAHRGVLRFGHEAPPGATAVVVWWQNGEHTVPVAEGYFYFVAWDVPYADYGSRPPQAMRYVKADGTQVPMPVDPLLERRWEWMREARRRLRDREWD
jgi:hypothetical protein